MTSKTLVVCLVLYRATTAHALAAPTTSLKQTPIPLTLLSGFLGAGKTTLLTHMLNNQQNTKIGVIVNDIAAVNIDAKLVSNENDAAWADDVVQLSNGCACCTGGDDLFASLAELVSLSFTRSCAAKDPRSMAVPCVARLRSLASCLPPRTCSSIWAFNRDAELMSTPASRIWVSHPAGQIFS